MNKARQTRWIVPASRASELSLARATIQQSADHRQTNSFVCAGPGSSRDADVRAAAGRNRRRPLLHRSDAHDEGNEQRDYSVSRPGHSIGATGRSPRIFFRSLQLGAEPARALSSQARHRGRRARLTDMSRPQDSVHTKLHKDGVRSTVPTSFGSGASGYRPPVNIGRHCHVYTQNDCRCVVLCCCSSRRLQLTAHRELQKNRPSDPRAQLCDLPQPRRHRIPDDRVQCARLCDPHEGKHVWTAGSPGIESAEQFNLATQAWRSPFNEHAKVLRTSVNKRQMYGRIRISQTVATKADRHDCPMD